MQDIGLVLASLSLVAVSGFFFVLLVGTIAADIENGRYLKLRRPQSLPALIYVAVANPARRLLGLSSFRIIPDGLEPAERAIIERADRLLDEIRSTLQDSPISPAKKASLARRAGELPENLARALWKLARLRRISESVDVQLERGRQDRADLAEMQDRLLADMTNSLQVLASISVSLLKVELARNDLAVDRLLADLDEANQRLRDMSASYTEIRKFSK